MLVGVGLSKDQLDSDGESMVDVSEKATSLPPCSKFGLDAFCTGPDCKNCRKALHGFSAESSPDFGEESESESTSHNSPRNFLSMVEEQKEKAKKEHSQSPLTMKTPNSKKPSFYGHLVLFRLVAVVASRFCL